MRTKFALALSLIVVAAASHAAEIPWVKDFAQAQKLAKASGKLIMVDFYTDWCGWCKKLDKDTYTSPKIVELSKQLVPLKTNAEKEGTALAKQHGVNGYPTILFLNGAGEVEGKIVGYMPPDAFGAEMTKVLNAHKEWPKLQAAMRAKPADGALNAKMASIYAGRGDLAKAAAHLESAEKAGYKGAEMGAAYNAVGDAYQTADKYDQAIPYFEKGERVALDTKTKSYSLVSMMSCYLSKRDEAGAKRIAQKILALQGAEPEYVKMAEDVLKPKK